MTTGHRLRHESQTLIVPILRGGEPMPFGVAKVFPSAMFVHAKEATDLKAHHVHGHKNVILVDSVVNSGKMVIEFMDRLKEIDCKAEHVVFVTGVAQSGAVEQKNEPLVQIKDAGVGRLSIVALRA
jgi:uracil phosphoribosyltransferase